MNNEPPGSARAGFPESPCDQICTLNEANICTGCRRTLEEITRWSLMSADEQWEIVAELAERAS